MRASSTDAKPSAVQVGLSHCSPVSWAAAAYSRIFGGGTTAPDPGTGVRWAPEVPRLVGLLIAHEWLDDVPLDVLFDGRVVVDGPASQSVSG